MHTESHITINAGIPPISADLEVFYSGEEHCLPNHSWGPMVRDHYVLHWVTSGGGLFVSGNFRVELNAGSCFLICPGAKTYYRADAAAPWHYSWVGFNGLKAGAVVAAVGFSPENPIAKHVGDKSKLQQYFTLLVQAESMTETSREFCRLSALYGIFAELSGTDSGKINPAAGTREAYIRRIMEYIERNYAKDTISAVDLARHVGIDRSHLARIFRQTMNTSPTGYLISFRIRKACELLTSRPDLSIKEIAYSVGYRDPLFFSRIFRQHKGLPPVEYRQRRLGGK